MRVSLDPIVWNKCMFCGEEIFSKTYKPLQVDIHGITQDEETKIVVYGYSHKLCRDHFNNKLNEFCNDMARFPENVKGEKQ